MATITGDSGPALKSGDVIVRVDPRYLRPPKDAGQSMGEKILLTGMLEATIEPYAIAKIAGIKLCEIYNRQYARYYRSAMPTNLYGPNDNFRLKNNHVILKVTIRFHAAK